MKKILMYLIILGILLLSIASVSAADNVTEDMVSVKTSDNVLVVNDNCESSLTNELISSSSDTFESNLNSNNNLEANSSELSNSNCNIFTLDSQNVLNAENNKMPTISFQSNTFFDSVKVYLKDSKGKQLTDIKITYNFDSADKFSTLYSGDTMFIPKDLKNEEYHVVTFAYKYDYSVIQKSIFFYKDYSKYNVVDIGINRTYFEVPVKDTFNDYLTVYLIDANNGKRIYENFTYYFDNSGTKHIFSGGAIELDFKQNSYHTITLEYGGLKQIYTPTVYTFKFNFIKPIVLDEAHKIDVEGGIKIPYICYNRNGEFIGRYYQFAPFGINNISFYNKYTGYTLIKEIYVQKRILESNDLKIDYEDIIEYKVRAANGNNQFTSRLNVTFLVDGKTYNMLTDEEGYATLKIHLKAGNYTITTKYWGVVNKNTITINPNYFDNNYMNIHVDSVTTAPGINKFVKYGWRGNFKGLLEIFDGQYLIKTINLDNSRYVGDYSYDEYSNSVPTSSLKEGVYVFKIVDKNDMVVTQSTVTIKKISTQVYGKNNVAYKNTKGLLYIRLFDKRTGDGISGNVKIKLNGKTYNVYIKDGEGTLTFKALPNFKKYTGTIIYEGDINYESSYDKFVITVVKSADSKIHVDSMSKIKPQSKIIVKAKVTTGYGANVNSGSVKFKINGITYKTKISNGVAKVKIKAPSKTRKYNCKAIYTGSKKIKSSSTSFSITVEPKYVDIEVPVAEGYTFAKYSGEYKVVSSLKVTYNSNTYLANISITPYKNNQFMQGLHSEFWIHEKSRGWIYLGYRVHGGDTSDVPKYNVLNVDKAKVRIHVY